MKSRAEEIHHDLIDKLEERVRKQYNMTMKEVEVRDRETGMTVGEIDLVGISESGWDIYEVKVTDNPKKAVMQLENLKSYLDCFGTINLYYYSGRDDKVTKVG